MSWFYFIFGLGAGVGVCASVISYNSNGTKNKKNEEDDLKMTNKQISYLMKKGVFERSKVDLEYCIKETKNGNSLARKELEHRLQKMLSSRQQLIEELKKE